MVLAHMIVILSSVWGSNGVIPQAPREGATITMHYGKPGQSRIGKHTGYGYKLNHDPNGVTPAPTPKHW